VGAEPVRVRHALTSILLISDLVAIVRFPHVPKLLDIAPQCVALAARQMIIVDHLLNVPDGAVQVAFIELATLPMLGEVPKLAFGVC